MNLYALFKLTDPFKKVADNFVLFCFVAGLFCVCVCVLVSSQIYGYFHKIN